MKKVVLVFWGLLLLLLDGSAQQNFHFIYIRFDHSMDRSQIRGQVGKLVSQCKNNNYALYYSNEAIVMDESNWDEDGLFGSIYETQQNDPIDLLSEIDKISSIIEKSVELYFDGNQMKFGKYASITFDFFVGEYFVENDYFTGIFAPLVIVNSLEDFVNDVQVHLCGYHPQDTILISPKYNLLKIENKIVIKN